MKQGNQIKNMLNKKMEHLALPLFAIFLGFVIGGLVIALSGYDPFATIGGSWQVDLVPVIIFLPH